MIFIIGGSCQGKLDFVRELLNVQNESITKEDRELQEY